MARGLHLIYTAELQASRRDQAWCRVAKVRLSSAFGRPLISDVITNCDLLTAFVGYDFVVSSFVRFVMPDDEAFL
ncbi:hypothetical protein L2E82_04644 [Cichorium intybus]|uniref:Uncharacterized protein n=1 Tax=Cichorium intybus TaxID=13427 RepID=A0ACB9H7Y2_CICIN|nr:hypothetical protein L2E82_04644 [Cichorium intybus]